VALAVGAAALIVAGPTSTPSSASTLSGAELVAAHFVSGFEGFPRQGRIPSQVVGLTTPQLAAELSSPSQAGTGPALAAEQFSSTARVVGFVVESDTPTGADLLARTEVNTATRNGSSSVVRLVPVTLRLRAGKWKVSAVGGLATTRGAGRHRTRAKRATAPPPVAPAPGATVVSLTAVADIPAAYVAWMEGAVASQCPGLPWTVLAGIAKVESDFGQSTLPGVASGSNSAGAEGPMQFEPATFAAYRTVAPGGADPATPYDPGDAIYSAARLLCADGGGDPAGLETAIFDYNHSEAYVSLVLAYANAYEQDLAGGASAGGTSATLLGATPQWGLGSVIVADAESYLGTPYVWGGEKPGSGFDCSGLVQWVYAEAGISLPRVAQDQFDAGPHLAAGATLYPGDLVFFGSGPSQVDHVGIYVGNGEMIDAPYTGVDVRFDRVASVSIGYVGATRPEIPDLTTGAGVPVVTSLDSYTSAASGSTSTPSRSATGKPTASPPGRSQPTVSHPTVSHPVATTTTTRRHPTTTVVTTTTAPQRVRRHPVTTTTTTAPPVSTTTSPPARKHPPTTTTVPPTTVPPTTVPPTTVPPTTVPPTTVPVPTTVPAAVPSTTSSTPGHKH
jgi:cell wall-associated NlpC family hydrolase